MSESNVIEENAKVSPSTLRSIGRFFEVLTMASVGVGLLWMSHDALYLFAGTLVALVLGFIAYCLERLAKPRKAKASKAESFGMNDRYLISTTSLEKMTADGVPWDVVGALARLTNYQPPLSSDKKPVGMTEVELIQQLVSLQCDLERINQFRKKILKNMRVEHTIDPPTRSNGQPSESEPAARASILEHTAAVQAP